MKAKVVSRLATDVSAAVNGSPLRIYAPSLRSLPEGSLLVMATLPVIDWNDCLLRDLRALSEKAGVHIYAAMVMIDPFACWEDFRDLLKAAEISGVVNFPPASIIEWPTAGAPLSPGREIELRRMEWFASLNFKTMFVAADGSEITVAERRLGSSLQGILHVREEDLAMRIEDEMELANAGQQELSIPQFSLSGAATFKETERKKRE
ncbi:hypothetical protein XH99_14215 [Bradyrhizobium nanningense]|uniref:Uncharacterized protein n=1 Tax=Bradyrhizobium nanningense TaxID=1325118 RepID=A0A4Q0S4T7_9BRAD|nr:hypothetical protein [Bradyrhizobium nanningense]RXH28950.1 hypothetical protein XH99_14215 [Bradyrhizobium nanningense]